MRTHQKLTTALATLALFSCASAPSPKLAWPEAAPAVAVAEAPPLTLRTEAVARGDEPVAARQSSKRDTLFLFHFGARELDDDTFWAPVDEPVLVGFEATSPFGDSPIGWEGAFFFSADRDEDLVDTTAVFAEFNLGLRVTADLGPVKLVGGGGGALIWGGVDFDPDPADLSDSDSSTGLYLHGGVLVELTGGLHLGFDLRAVSGTDIQFDGFVESDID